MPNYNYTHGSTVARNRLRFLIGDHRGTNGTSSTGWLFSDEELDDVLSLVGNNVQHAARVCLQCRINREAMAAGVAGTTDTSDRPIALVNALRSLEKLDLPGYTVLPRAKTTDSSTLDDNDLLP